MIYYDINEWRIIVIKDDIKKAGALCVYFEDKVIQEVERIIDEELQMQHSEISRKIEKILDTPGEMTTIEKTLNVIQ